MKKVILKNKTIVSYDDGLLAVMKVTANKYRVRTINCSYSINRVVAELIINSATSMKEALDITRCHVSYCRG